MSDSVRVIRYIRPCPIWDGDDTLTGDVNYGLYTNLYGITVVYDINYTTGEVSARWAICNGDNFSKKEGRERAIKSNKVVNFPFYLVDREGSLNQALVSVIDGKKRYFSPYLFEDYLNLFLSASRKL